MFQREPDGPWMMRIKAGAVVAVPKALRFDRNVAGQVPTGWDPVRLGVPPEIAQSVDPVTRFTLATISCMVSPASLTNCPPD